MISLPSSLAGMALPMPALVYGVGKVKAAVLGLADESVEYMLPEGPAARV